MTVSVVIPTVTGREEWLEQCVKAYGETTPDAEVIVVTDRASCGIAWGVGAAQATGEYIHFTADDLAPLPGWWEAAVEVVDEGKLPAANVLTAQLTDGDWDPNSSMDCNVFLHDGFRAPNVLVPFFNRAIWDLGDWVIPIHYGSDDWITYLADFRGIEIEATHRYRFTHGAAPEGRLTGSRSIDLPILCDWMHEYTGVVPPEYQQIGRQHGWRG